jgi:hypothetical protein
LSVTPNVTLHIFSTKVVENIQLPKLKGGHAATMPIIKNLIISAAVIKNFEGVPHILSILLSV